MLCDLSDTVTLKRISAKARGRHRQQTLPVCALYILAMLSMLPVMKKTPSGDQAISYISEPIDRHMCLTRHVSLSSNPSSPNVAGCVWFSDGTQRRILPSSPALPRSSPKIEGLDNGTVAVVCLYAYLEDTIGLHSQLACALRG